MVHLVPGSTSYFAAGVCGSDSSWACTNDRYIGSGITVVVWSSLLSLPVYYSGELLFLYAQQSSGGTPV